MFERNLSLVASIYMLKRFHNDKIDENMISDRMFRLDYHSSPKLGKPLRISVQAYHVFHQYIITRFVKRSHYRRMQVTQ